MAKLKIRFVINQGRRGAPMAKLGKISEQAEKFLRDLAHDCGVQVKPGEWLAADFKNSSVQFDAEYQGSVGQGEAQVFERSMEILADFDPDRDGLNGVVRESTALEYAKIGSLIDPDEVIRIGIIPHRGGSPKWRDITYQKAETIKTAVETPIPTYGSLQGIIHAWFKEARVPYFQFRELASDALVRIEYAARQYGNVADALREKNAVLLVAGDCFYDRGTRSIATMKLDRITKTNVLSTGEFDSLFGSFPDWETQELLEDAS